MNFFIKLFLTFFFSISIYAEREIEFSLNSDSIWRGLTQNDGNPTLGMDLNVLLKNGLTTGIWIESCCSESSSYPNREVGFFLGYQKEINDNLNFSLSYIGTNYPNSKIDNYDELGINFSFYDFEISYFKGLNDFPDYYELSYAYNFLSNDLILSYGDFDPYINNNSSNGKNYSIGIDSFLEDFTLGFFYYYFNASSSSDNDDDGFVFSISKKTSF